MMQVTIFCRSVPYNLQEILCIYALVLCFAKTQKLNPWSIATVGLTKSPGGDKMEEGTTSI